ncbi:nonstructural protein 1 [Pacific black duck chaphamaparvovirus 1]|uniref:Nonstructural protein 1 n=1 Tax=Pacific black duck chaphamaparvovirus 1 TaxID=2759407 RepID=A0A7D7AT68_9VIRU|nr:nonstructural protein 1 [Pacific black duck chaphamaparvovirus 1]QMI57781.1 nonstructural protein 1 [Pacific black duck chaphamaparvovirus 1]
MERSGYSYGIYKWTRSAGESIGIILGGQEDTPLIQQKDFVARPMPIYEAESNLINMKTFLGIVLQAADENGEIISDMIVYGSVLNGMQCCEEWICIGENNKHGIFHVHALIKCSVRSDSFRRSFMTTWKSMHTHVAFIDRWGPACTIDMLKCQRAHNPRALLEYMCKNPHWCLTNSMRLAQRAYDINAWDLASRFRQESGEKEVSIDQGNPMVQEIVTAIQTTGAKNIEELMRCKPDVFIKHLHKPGLQTIVQNCLTFVKCLGQTWSLKNYERFTPDPSAIHGILLTQGINPDLFDSVFVRWICKLDSKRNTICLLGPSNSGKTTFIRGFRGLCPAGEICNGQNFNFEDIVDRYWAIWDEPLLGPEQADKFKQLAGGEPCVVPVKFKKPAHIPRTPIWINTNHEIWRWCPGEQKMFENRMWTFKFRHNISDGMFNPRTSESSCKCRYCIQLTSSQASTSSEPTERLHTEKRSEITGEFMASGDGGFKKPMGPGPMRKRKGSSRESAERDSGEPGPSTSKSWCSSSTSTSTSSGSDSKHGSSNTGIGVCSSGPGTSQSFQSNVIRRNYGADRAGSARTRGRFCSTSGGDSDADGPDLWCYEETDSMVPMGRARCEEFKMELQTEQRKLVEQVGTLVSPTQEHWEQYLAAIWKRYKEVVIERRIEGMSNYPISHEETVVSQEQESSSDDE